MCTTGLALNRGECQKQDRIVNKISALLELSAADDLNGFKTAVELEGHDVDELGLWYGRIIGSKKMGLEERTPLMIASMFGSKQVLNYILGLGCVDVNKACGSDGATALHCAVAGSSASSPEVVKLLLDASADINQLDFNGNRPADLIDLVFGSSFNSVRRVLDLMLKGYCDSEDAHVLGESTAVSSPRALKDGTERKEYPIDISLPDMKNGIYGTDEFRMYTFKIKPCSRAYSHDWTECPFVHPGENARRRDPRKYHYSCVPCPEFRKGSCRQGDACEYAHGIFECWLHPAQYRTRLCKDETGCNRKVCFFAHKPEELRPLYASTGSAVLSPRSLSVNTSLDISSISPFSLGSPNQSSPSLMHLGSRFKNTLSARDLDLDAELLGLENSYRYRQQLADEFSGLSLSSPTNLGWNNTLANGAGDCGGEFNLPSGLNHANIDLLASLDPTILSQLRQNMNQQLHPNYSAGLSSSPLRASSSFGVDQAGSGLAAINSRSAAFAKRSQSFIDRGALNRHSGFSSPVSSSPTMMPSMLSDWGSPDGKLNWGVKKEELSKFRKSASFGFRSSGSNYGTPDHASVLANGQDPGSPWSIVKDGPAEKQGNNNKFEEEQHFPPWVEQLYMEQEQLVA